MQNLNFKAMNGQMAVDEVQGIVECFVAAIGNKDSVGDIIISGAFDKSFKKRKPRVVWGHDWNQPIGKVLDIYEVGPRDPRLPAKMQQAGVGGVFAKVQFNLNSERGREAFSNILFFGEEQEWSIGYKTLDAVWDPGTQANILKELELYEVSPVLHGANQLTATISIKDAKGADVDEDEITSLRDSKWDTFDIAWAKKLQDEHPDIWGKGGNIKGNDQWRILTQIAAKGKATTQAELNALKLREAWIARHKGDFLLPGVVAQIKWLAVGSRGESYMKNVVREAIDKKKEKSFDTDDISIKARPLNGVAAGNFVRWDSSGGTAYGKVLKIAKGGTITAKPVGPTMKGTEDNPAVEVQVWRFANGSWDETDTVTVHRFDALQPIDKLPKTKAPSTADLDVITDAIGLDPLPQERITGDVMRGYGPRRGNLERLLRYWRPIMRKPGGFRRCRVILADHPELYPLENLCAWLHHETTGLWPNEGCHHPGMKNCRKKMRGVVNGSVISDAEFTAKLRKLGKKDASTSIEDYAPAEQQFIRSMLAIVAEHGKLSDGDDNGIYVGYTPADENEVAGMGIKCANCAFYAGGAACRLIKAEVEPGGKCRLAAIDYDSVEDDDEDEEELLKRFSVALRDFAQAEPEFMEFLADDDNWAHEGQEHDEDDWHEHDALVPMKKGGCGCGGEKGGCGCGGKSDPAGMDTKAGRALSGRNRTRLRDAVQLIRSVLDEADVSVKGEPVSGRSGVSFKAEDPHGFVADIAPVVRHHGLSVKVDGGTVVFDPDMDDEALDALGTVLDSLGYDAKGILGRIGGAMRGGFGRGGRGGRGGGPRPEAVDPNAEDGDNDGIVQDNTTAARPATPKKPKVPKFLGGGKRKKNPKVEERDSIKKFREAVDKDEAEMKEVGDALAKFSKGDMGDPIDTETYAMVWYNPQTSRWANDPQDDVDIQIEGFLITEDVKGKVVVDLEENRVGLVREVSEPGERESYRSRSEIYEDGPVGSAEVDWYVVDGKPGKPVTERIHGGEDEVGPDGRYQFHEPDEDIAALLAEDKMESINWRENMAQRVLTDAFRVHKEDPETAWDMVYALEGNIPPALFERMLKSFKAGTAPKEGTTKVAADHAMHADMLPVVRHHGIGYTVKGDLVMYDVSTASAEARSALLSAKAAVVGEVKRDYGPVKRMEYARKGWALPDGSYPIRDKGDLDNAIKAYGRAKDKAKAKAHIVKRARQLRATSILPEGWV